MSSQRPPARGQASHSQPSRASPAQAASRQPDRGQSNRGRAGRGQPVQNQSDHLTPTTGRQVAAPSSSQPPSNSVPVQTEGEQPIASPTSLFTVTAPPAAQVPPVIADFPPFASLPIAKAASSSHDNDVLDLQEGIYRIQNNGAAKLLSCTTRQPLGPPSSTPSLVGWDGGLPVDDDDLAQTWSIKIVPPPRSGPSFAPKAFIIESCSTALKSTTGTGVFFRLETYVAQQLQQPYMPTGRSMIPNNLAPPRVLIIPGPPQADVPPKPAPSLQPKLEDYVGKLQVSPQGSTASHWQCVPIDQDQYRAKYLLLNPATGMYAGCAPVMPQASATSVAVNVVPNGLPIKVVHLKQYLKDVSFWLAANTSTDSKLLLATLTAQLEYFAWTLHRSDLGPARGTYRIVCRGNMGALTMDSSASPTMVVIKPGETKPQVNQVWQLSPAVDQVSSISYTITNAASQTSLSSGRWRCVFVPYAYTDLGTVTPTLALPNPTPTIPTSFLLLDTWSMNLLAWSPSNQLDHVPVSAMAVAGSAPYNKMPPWDIPAIANMMQRFDNFMRDNWHLVWTLYPESWNNSDGLYTFQTNQRYLDIPPQTSSATIPLSLSPPYAVPMSGSTWWHVESAFDDSGATYQKIWNYRSAHVVDISGPDVVGLRLGNTKDEKWRLVSGRTPPNLAAIQNFQTYDAGLVDNGSGHATFRNNTEINATWSVSQVDLNLPSGSYHILNLEWNNFLSSSSNRLLLGADAYAWSISKTNQGYSISPGGPNFLSLASGEPVITPTPEYFTIRVESSGAFTIWSSLALSANSDLSLQATSASTDLSQRWRILSTSGTKTFSVPSWLGNPKVLIPPNMPDGVYRISHAQSRSIVSISNQAMDQSPATVQMVPGIVEEAGEYLWYIERNRDPLLTPVTQTYTFRNLAHNVNLQECELNIGQPAGGLQVCVASDGHSSPAVLQTQQWMCWRTLPDKTAASGGWVFQAVGGSGGLLDFSGPNLLTTRPQLEAGPSLSQIWRLEAVRPLLSSGYYSIRGVDDSSFLSVDQTSNVVLGSYSHVAADWKLTVAKNGLYYLQSMVNVAFLTASSGAVLTPIADTWMVSFISGNLYLQQRSSARYITQNGRSITMDAKGTPWVLNRVDQPSPAFKEIVSDKIPAADYTVLNQASSQSLDWPVNPMRGSNLIASSQQRSWTVSPSAGCYTITSRQHSIGSGAVASGLGLDSALWKLIKFENDSYAIVNKSTGLLLAQVGNRIVEIVQNASSIQSAKWNLAQRIPRPSSQYIEREAAVTNGIYSIASVATRNIISLPSTTSQVTTSIRDLTPFAYSSRTQLWIIEKLPDSWLIIKSLPYGKCIGYNGQALVLNADDGTDVFRWKFVVTKDGSLRCLAKRDSSCALSAGSALNVVPNRAGDTEKWNLLRMSGTAMDTILAQGTYFMSQYVQITKEGLASQAQSAKRALDAGNIEAAIATVEKIASVYNASSSQGKLSSGVSLVQIESNLTTPSDSAKLPPAFQTRVAHSVTVIVSVFFGDLYSRSLRLPGPVSGLSASLSVASNKLARFIINWCTIPPPSNANTFIVIQQLQTVCQQTQLLSDTKDQTVQQVMSSFGHDVVQTINAYILTLDTRHIILSAGSVSDPYAPKPLVTLSGNSVIMSAALPGTIPQLWLFEYRNNAFQISHLTSTPIRYLSVINGELGLNDQPYSWTIAAQRLGGYAIFATPTTVLSTSLSLVSYVPDGGDVAAQRWQLRRSGYYLQSQDDGNFSSLVCANPDNSVTLTAFRPFSQEVLLGDGARSDSSNIWHLGKDTKDGQYKIYNEHTRTTLTTGDGSAVTISTNTTRPPNSDLWQFAKNGAVLWLQCIGNTRWLGVNGKTVATAIPPDQTFKTAGWQLVSVALTDRGPLMSLPRYALVNYDGRVWSNQGLVDYAPDDSFQRWRSYTYAGNILYINEATTGLLSSNGTTTTDLTGTDDPNVWWIPVNNTTVRSQGDTAKMTLATNTGDLTASTTLVRIQLSNGQALDVINGDVIPMPFDRLSTSQTWTVLDWQQGRYVKHVATNTLLSRVSNGISTAPANAYSAKTLWTVKTTNTSGKNGFFPLMVPGTQNGLQLDFTVSSKPAGIRFIADSSWPSFTTQSSVLTRFISTHGPVFCYLDNAPLPLRVEDFVTNATLTSTNSSSAAASFANLLPQGLGKLTLNAPSITLGQAGPAYITVRDSPDGAYLNHTDFTFSLLYASGWSTLTLRYNNETNNLIAAKSLDPRNGTATQGDWTYNLDSNFATNLPVGINPLRMVKRADGSTRLHILVGSASTRFDFPRDRKDADVAAWSRVVDGGQGVMVEADMISDDERGSGVVPPDWSRWAGTWGGQKTLFIGAVGKKG